MAKKILCALVASFALQTTAFAHHYCTNSWGRRVSCVHYHGTVYHHTSHHVSDSILTLWTGIILGLAVTRSEQVQIAAENPQGAAMEALINTTLEQLPADLQNAPNAREGLRTAIVEMAN